MWAGSLVKAKCVVFRTAPLLMILNIALMIRVLELEEKIETSLDSIQSKHKLDKLDLQDSSIIDLKDFKFLLNDDICNEDKIGIITIVSSAFENKAGIINH